MRDIETRKDIDDLMIVFYNRAFEDDMLGYIFKDVARLDLDHHLPIIGDFWESLLLSNPVYQRHRRNPLQVHAVLDAKSPLEPKHFYRWLDIFHRAVDEMFAGERATFAKLRAEAIANRFMNFLGQVPDFRAIA